MHNDWLPYVPVDRYFIAEKNGKLSIWSRLKNSVKPFTLTRKPTDDFLHWWLIGFYQAEGSKKRAIDFHVANTNPLLLERMINALSLWGLDSSRLRLGVVHRTGTDPTPAVDLYKPLGIRIAFVTAKPKNDAIGILYVNGSGPLAKTVCPYLTHLLNTRSFPNAAAAKAYALGWLDGDGSINIDHRTHSISLRLAGDKEEILTVISALEHGLGWNIQNGAFGPLDGQTSRALSLNYAAELAAAGAFFASMSRARLIHGLSLRLPMHGMSTRGRTLTSAHGIKQAQYIFDTVLANEAEKLSIHPLAINEFSTNKKGARYPLKEWPPTT